MMDYEKLIDMLLGHTYPEDSRSEVPDYLSNKYDREGAAINLGELGNAHPKILGALLKACFSDEEEDVRLASLEALYKLDDKCAVSAAYFLLEDESEDVMETAAELVQKWNKI